MKLTKNQISNIQSIRRPNAAGVKGVWKERDKWRARITFNGKPINLGSHDTIEDAKEAYEAAAQRFFGSYYRNTESIRIDVEAAAVRGELYRLRSNLGAIKSMLKRAQGEVEWALETLREDLSGVAEPSEKANQGNS
jgi:hypothetical protein